MSSSEDQLNKPGQIKDQGLNWEINESLLQSHRSIFIASQSLFISAAALTDKSLLINFIIIIIAIIQLWIGFKLIVTRARIVDFYKFNISRFSCTEENYIKCQEAREGANVKNEELKNWRWTRRKIDFWIPFSFMVIWISFLTKCFCATCKCPKCCIFNISPVYCHILLFLIFCLFISLLFFPTLKWAFGKEGIFTPSNSSKS